MKTRNVKVTRRIRRKRHIRHRVVGTTDRPRFSVFRSNCHISAQIIDDSRGVTICQASSLNKSLSSSIKYGGNIEAAVQVGAAIAEAAKSQGIEKVTFDRNGYKFHGRVKALADAVRKSGLVF